MKNIATAAAILVLALGSYNAVAQNTHLDYKYAVKLYNLTTIGGNEEIYSDSSFIRTGSFNRLMHPAPAVQIATRKKNFHEIELSDLSIGRREELTERTYPGQSQNITISGEVTTITSVALRYEYIANFAKKKARRLVPAVGFAAMPYYTRYQTDPVITVFFPTRDNFFGLRSYIVPRLAYYINKRIFADINLPVNLFNLQHKSTRSFNSVLPASQQTTSSFSFDLLPAYYSVRAGVGVKL
jgi:hypothetical protein